MRTDRLVAWLGAAACAPLIALASLRLSTAMVRVSASLLIVPLAADLARRHGRAGLVVAALAGSPLLVEVRVAGALLSPADVGAYASALLIGWWILAREAAARPPLPRRPGAWWLVVLALLPIELGLGRLELDGDVALGWVVAPYAAFFTLVLGLGMARAPSRRVWMLLCAAAAVGVGLEYLVLPGSAAELLGARAAELPWLGLVELRPLFVGYAFDTPAELATAGAFFLAGRALGDRLEARAARAALAPWQRLVMLAGVALLALGGPLSELAAPDVGAAGRVFGSAYALALTAALSGFWYRFGGIVAVALALAASWWAGGVVEAELRGWETPRVVLELGDLLLVYGFGLLGIGLRDALDGGRTRLWSGVWCRYLIVLGLLVPALLPLREPGDGLAIIVVFLAAVAATLLLGDALRRLRGRTIALEGGWLSLASVLGIGYLLYGFLAQAWGDVIPTTVQALALLGQLLRAREALDGRDLSMLATTWCGWLLLAWLLTSSIERLVRSAGELLADVRMLLARWRAGTPATLRLDWPSRAPAPRPAAASPGLRVLAWANRILLVAAFAGPVALAGYDAWLVFHADRSDARRDTLLERFGTDLAPRVESRRERLDAARDARGAVDEAVRDAAAGDQALLDALERAAIRVLAGYPDVARETGRGRSTITTGWRIMPDAPGVRRRVVVRLSTSARRSPSSPERAAVRVDMRRQDRGRFGLWLEDVDGVSSWREERAVADRLERAIEAEALAD